MYEIKNQYVTATQVCHSDLLSERTVWEESRELSAVAPLGSAPTFTPRPNSPQMAPSQWLGMTGVLELGHFYSMWNFSTGHLCAEAPYKSGWDFCRGHCSLRLLLLCPSSLLSPFTSVRSETWSEVSLGLLLFPLLFVFHRHSPQYIYYISNSASWRS